MSAHPVSLPLLGSVVLCTLALAGCGGDGGACAGDATDLVGHVRSPFEMVCRPGVPDAAAAMESDLQRL